MPRGMESRVLHQFPISHYCEKTRWHLDWKGLPYRVRNLVPGVHRLVNRRLGGAGTVPLLVDQGRAISDSTDISAYLDATYPERVLLPEGGAGRARVLELEEYFDETFGPAVRRWTYALAMSRPGMVGELFFSGYGPVAKKLGPPILGRPLEKVLYRMYRLGPGSKEKAEKKIEAALERLESELAGDPSRYLVGDTLTLADVTAASLLAPLVGAPESPYATAGAGDAEIAARRASLRERVAGRWVMNRYAQDRPRSLARP
jgi:glutathione S-transferase